MGGTAPVHRPGDAGDPPFTGGFDVIGIDEGQFFEDVSHLYLPF
jgi:hypothetical protein